MIQRGQAAIVIGGNPEKPEISKVPEQLAVRKGERLRWQVTNVTGAAQQISLEGFARVGVAASIPLLDDPEAVRQVTVDITAGITATVRPDAEPGIYKYSIWLNEVEAVDPEVIVEG